MTRWQFYVKALREPGWRLGDCYLTNDRLRLSLWVAAGFPFLNGCEGSPSIPFWYRPFLWFAVQKTITREAAKLLQDTES